jgi:hypothetical protein
MRDTRRQGLRFKDKRLRLKSRMKRLREQRFPDLDILQVKNYKLAVNAVVHWWLPGGDLCRSITNGMYQGRNFGCNFGAIAISA